MKPRPRPSVIITDRCLPMVAVIAVSLYTLAAWAWLGYTIIQHLTR